MKRLSIIVSVVLLLALTAVLTVGAGGGPYPVDPDIAPPSADTGEMVFEGSNMWFVEFPSKPLAAGGKKADVDNDYNTFNANAKKFGLKYSERFAFSTLWNGVSIELAPGQSGTLSMMPGVKAIYPVMMIAQPEVITGLDPQLGTAIQMTGADIAQNELGYTGAGVHVAVMDTGIDYDHPDLGGCFGPGCRVETGWDFVGDAYNADSSSPSYNPVPNPDDDPDDCQGHGTHVSGIVGANGDVVGVAPGVTFGAYRVFGCEGSTTADIMIAAMEAAYADDMDILNMSIGSAFTWPEYPTAVASNTLVDRGMVVVASIGNSGASGTYSAGAPGLGSKVIGVASFDNVNATFPILEVNGEDFGYNPMSGAAEPPTSGTEEMVYIGLACNGMPLEDDPSGKVALISRGSCSFRDKTLNATAAGATAVVVHNNASGNFNGTLGSPALPYVAVSISGEDGAYIKSLPQPWLITWTDRVGSFPNPTGGTISSFSSYGLAPDLTFKPDLGAPGGSIWSTYPLEKGEYASLGGTSMASPHVAGAAALLLEAHPGTPAAAVGGMFQNYADPASWSLIPGYIYLEPAFRQGAGLLDIDDVILGESFVTPSELALGESEAGPYSAALTITNGGDSDVTYDLGSESLFGCCSAGISVTGTFAEELDFWLSDEVVSFDSTSVIVPAGGSATVNVTIDPPIAGGSYQLAQYGGWLTFTPDDGGDPLRVPYAGFLGDYQELDVLTPGPYGFPLLGVSLGGGNYNIVPEGWVFTMEDEFTQPAFLIHLNHQSTYMEFEIYNADTGEPVHPTFYTGLKEWWLPRNSTSGGFYAFGWNGTRYHNNGLGNEMFKMVPDGNYYVVVNVLKALGDWDNPDHWETWTSPFFTIDRP